jgi:hypothetical protein
MPEGLMLLFFLSCLRLDVNNLETTCSIENTITGKMVDIEEFTEQKLDPPARPVTSILLPRKTNWPTETAAMNSTREDL